MEQLDITDNTLDELDEILKTINKKLDDQEENNVDKEKLLKNINELIDNFESE